MRALGDKVFFLSAFLAGDRELAVAPDQAAELDVPSISEMTAVILRPPRLKEFFGTGKAACDVFGPGDFSRNLGQNIAGKDLIAVLDFQIGPGGQIVPSEQDRLSVLVLFGRMDDLHPRLHLFVLGLDDDMGDQSGEFVLDLLHGDAEDDIMEFGGTAFLSQNKGVERIPLGKRLAGFDRIAVLNENSGSIRHLVMLDFPVTVIEDGDIGVAVDNDQDALLI